MLAAQLMSLGHSHPEGQGQVWGGPFNFGVPGKMFRKGFFVLKTREMSRFCGPDGSLISLGHFPEMGFLAIIGHGFFDGGLDSSSFLLCVYFSQKGSLLFLP